MIKIYAVKITPQSTTTGANVLYEVTAKDVTWEVIKADFTGWNAVKTSFNGWEAVKNYK